MTPLGLAEWVDEVIARDGELELHRVVFFAFDRLFDDSMITRFEVEFLFADFSSDGFFSEIIPEHLATFHPSGVRIDHP